MMIPASALGRAGRAAPSERIVVGSIGVGNMGFGDMNALMSIPEVQVVAVCDVKRAMRERAKQAVDAHYGTRTARPTTISANCSPATTSTPSASPRSTRGTCSMPWPPCGPARTSTSKSRWA